MNIKNETITLDKSQYAEADVTVPGVRDKLKVGMEVLFQVSEPEAKIFVPRVGPLRMATIYTVQEETITLLIRDDFKYDDEVEEEEVKIVNPSYLGDGVFKIKFEDFIKFCVRCDETLQKEIQLENGSDRNQISQQSQGISQ